MVHVEFFMRSGGRFRGVQGKSQLEPGPSPTRFGSGFTLTFYNIQAKVGLSDKSLKARPSPTHEKRGIEIERVREMRKRGIIPKSREMSESFD